MTSEEVAQLLHVDPVTIRRLVTRGELSAYRIGADYRFAPSDVQAYLQRQHLPTSVHRSSHAQRGGTVSGRQRIPAFGQNELDDTIGESGVQVRHADCMHRFTKSAQHVLLLAQEEVQHFQHGSIEPEYLLLGLIRERDSLASRVLSNLGIEDDQIRNAIEASTEHSSYTIHDEPGLSSRAKKVLEFAVDEARLLNHSFVGTEHVLLALIREHEGITANLFKHLGISLAQVRRETLQALQQQRLVQEEETPIIPPVPAGAKRAFTEEDSVLTCLFCGARCPDYFHYCFNCGQRLLRMEPLHGEKE